MYLAIVLRMEDSWRIEEMAYRDFFRLTGLHLNIDNEVKIGGNVMIRYELKYDIFGEEDRIVSVSDSFLEILQEMTKLYNTLSGGIGMRIVLIDNLGKTNLVIEEDENGVGFRSITKQNLPMEK